MVARALEYQPAAVMLSFGDPKPLVDPVLDLFDDLWVRNDLDEGESLDLAVEAQHATRRAKR